MMTEFFKHFRGLPPMQDRNRNSGDGKRPGGSNRPLLPAHLLVIR